MHLPHMESELHAKAKSLSRVAIEPPLGGPGLGETPVRQRDLGDIAGTWLEDPEFDQAIAEQDQIDER